tara:strand:+ start:389 stop:901 length:513 start_codon:yes stop_codon:yes gene_type:complete
MKTFFGIELDDIRYVELEYYMSDSIFPKVVPVYLDIIDVHGDRHGINTYSAFPFCFEDEARALIGEIAGKGFESKAVNQHSLRTVNQDVTKIQYVLKDNLLSASYNKDKGEAVLGFAKPNSDRPLYLNFRVDSYEALCEMLDQAGYIRMLVPTTSKQPALQTPPAGPSFG